MSVRHARIASLRGAQAPRALRVRSRLRQTGSRSGFPPPPTPPARRGPGVFAVLRRQPEHVLERAIIPALAQAHGALATKAIRGARRHRDRRAAWLDSGQTCWLPLSPSSPPAGAMTLAPLRSPRASSSASHPGTRARRRPRSALAALERAVLPRFRRPPCLVSFSGGQTRPSSSPSRPAWRSGRPPDVPATNRFPAAEGKGQVAGRVVAHLGLDDWLRIRLADELDCVGQDAQDACDGTGCSGPSTRTSIAAPRAAGARCSPASAATSSSRAVLGARFASSAGGSVPAGAICCTSAPRSRRRGSAGSS
jgi:hypothetical protein